jgi:capsular exopolysaccharide synthesis family protein
MAPIVKQLQALYPKITYESLFNGVNITAKGEKTLILTVSYQDKDPKQVKTVLDTVSKAYLDYSLNTRQTGIRRGIDFVEGQLPQLQESVAVQQQRLQKIRQQNNIIDPEVKGQQLSTLIGSFEQQQLQTQLELNEAKALYSSMQQELTRQEANSVALAALAENTRYQNLLNQLLEIDSQMAKSSALLLEESAEIKTLKQQRQNLLPLLRREGLRVARETSSRIQQLETRNKLLTQTLGRLNRDVKQLSLVLRQYNDIQRELEIATENLNQFLSKREGLKIDAAQKELPWRLLTPPPEELAPVSISLQKNLLLGAILGLLLGLGAALASDKLSNLLYTSQEVKEVAKLPILGVIPFERVLEKLSPLEERSALINRPDRALMPIDRNGNGKSQAFSPSPAFLEAFRFLYTNIRLLKSNPPIQSLVISSASSEDGKSTIALYLAQTAASMGQRVLLVDIDLRYSSLHERLMLSNQQGVSDILSSETLDFNHAIQRSPLEDNLYILTSGSIPDDPTRFLASVKMQELMERLQAAFDLVIYKASSLSEFADPYLLANHTNGILLVAGLGKLKRPVLEHALDELRISGTPILGLVANMARNSVSASRREELKKEQVAY